MLRPDGFQFHPALSLFHCVSLRPPPQCPHNAGEGANPTSGHGSPDVCLPVSDRHTTAVGVGRRPCNTERVRAASVGGKQNCALRLTPSAAAILAVVPLNPAAQPVGAWRGTLPTTPSAGEGVRTTPPLSQAAECLPIPPNATMHLFLALQTLPRAGGLLQPARFWPSSHNTTPSPHGGVSSRPTRPPLGSLRKPLFAGYFFGQLSGFGPARQQTYSQTSI